MLAYSMTAAIGALMAHRGERVHAAVLRGFPILADYSAIHASAVADAHSAPEGLDFDPAAGLALYRDLATTCAIELVFACRCPVLSFRARVDESLVRLGWRPEHDRVMSDHGIETLINDGHGHDTAPFGLDAHADTIIAALRDEAPGVERVRCEV